MYSALCPNCGAAMTASYGGSVLARCSQCPWMGQVTFRWLTSSAKASAAAGVNFLSGIQFATLPPSPAPLPDPSAESDPLEARREALWTRFHHIAGMVYELLRTVDTEDWQMPAADVRRRYERWQEAHGALYMLLGGARMGDYRPASHALDEALASVLLWALLTLDAVER